MTSGSARGVPVGQGAVDVVDPGGSVEREYLDAGIGWGPHDAQRQEPLFRVACEVGGCFGDDHREGATLGLAEPCPRG